jgi:pyruvate/2-oxoglutarate dehydrogenase complex dihydrolipoamide dehydrogenase (E3) component
MEQRIANIEAKVGVLQERVGQKIDRSELHEWKDTILERLRLEIEDAFRKHDARNIERQKVHGHETASQIGKAISELRADIVSLFGPNAPEPRSSGAGDAVNVPQWVLVVGGVVIGAVFGQYIMPTILRLLVQKMTGG